MLAVDDGADVINLSLGSPQRSTAVENAVQYALDHGVTVVVASGNARLDGDPVIYPASQAGGRGRWRPPAATASWRRTPRPPRTWRVAAPGTDVLSTVPGGWGLPRPAPRWRRRT